MVTYLLTLTSCRSFSHLEELASPALDNVTSHKFKPSSRLWREVPRLAQVHSRSAAGLDTENGFERQGLVEEVAPRDPTPHGLRCSAAPPAAPPIGTPLYVLYFC